MNSFRTIHHLRTLPVALVALAVGCLPAEPIIEERPQPTITTQINCSGEWNVGPSEPFSPIIDTTQHFKPSKTDAQNLLAIQIYAKSIGGTDKYQPFAYGLFDQWQQIEVELVATNTYKIVASLVVEATTQLEQNALGYSEPFAAGAERTKATNTFLYTSSRSMSGLTAGAARLASDQRRTRPPIERYCAVLTDYVPTEDQTAELNLQRVSFALKVSAPDLVEGSIELNVDGAPPIVLDIGQANTSTEVVLSMLGSSFDERWLDATYIDKILCKASWKKGNGLRVPIGPAGGVTLQVRRNHRIPIALYTRGKPNGFQISTEKNPWIDQPSVVF